MKKCTGYCIAILVDSAHQRIYSSLLQLKRSSHWVIRLGHISPRILETVCRHIGKCQTLAAPHPLFLLRLRLHPLKGHFYLVESLPDLKPVFCLIYDWAQNYERTRSTLASLADLDCVSAAKLIDNEVIQVTNLSSMS